LLLTGTQQLMLSLPDYFSIKQNSIAGLPMGKLAQLKQNQLAKGDSCVNSPSISTLILRHS
jgi:hypothetical protein